MRDVKVDASKDINIWRIQCTRMKFFEANCLFMFYIEDTWKVAGAFIRFSTTPFEKFIGIVQRTTGTCDE